MTRHSAASTYASDKQDSLISLRPDTDLLTIHTHIIFREAGTARYLTDSEAEAWRGGHRAKKWHFPRGRDRQGQCMAQDWQFSGIPSGCNIVYCLARVSCRGHAFCRCPARRPVTSAQLPSWPYGAENGSVDIALSDRCRHM